MATSTIEHPKVVSRADWLAARRELLKKEKELTRATDEVNRQRRELPWIKVEKEYVFDGPDGKVALADLFGGRSQLIIRHFMLVRVEGRIRRLFIRLRPRRRRARAS